MKKHIATITMVIGLGVTAYGQGTVTIANYNNTSNSPTATSGGLVFTNNLGHTGLIQDNVGFTLLAGADTNSLSPVVTITSLTSGGTFWDSGQFVDPSLATRTIGTIPAKTPGWFEIQMWYDPTGQYNSYAQALAAPGGITGAVWFSNPTGGGTTPPSTLTGMPALMLTGTVPEPTTFAMVGLGSAALLIFRRRKTK